MERRVSLTASLYLAALELPDKDIALSLHASQTKRCQLPLLSQDHVMRDMMLVFRRLAYDQESYINCFCLDTPASSQRCEIITCFCLKLTNKAINARLAYIMLVFTDI